MFESLSQNIGKAFSSFKGVRVIKESHIEETVDQIRMALLEADVALEVVDEFVTSVKFKALGEHVIKSVSPEQMFIKIVQDEIIKLLGEGDVKLNFQNKGVSVFLMVGLQGTGKTTSAAKLAKVLSEKYSKKVLTASLDSYRPAAKEQLKIMSEKAGVESLEYDEKEKPEKTAKRALKFAKKNDFDVLILDTAGRLSIDQELIDEVKRVKKISDPVETLLVADSLSGQDAVNTAKIFNKETELTGLILTRLDGDQRGGACLSMKYITKLPIKFQGYGESVNDFDVFYPDRIASRILDMGDIVSLVEKAGEVVSEQEAQDLQKKLAKGKFDLDDLLKQIKTMKKMGGMSSLLAMMPGAGKIKDMMATQGIDEKSIAHQEALILSMTKWERQNPEKLTSSRKRRIAKGSGLKMVNVNQLLKKFKDMQKMTKKFGNMDQSQMEAMMAQMQGKMPGGF
jgi:signal recognition particle subunit SRP54